VTINGKPAADAGTADRRGRSLLHWSGCMALARAQVLVLAAAPDSFDGRYFGPIDRTYVLGAARPVWVKQHDGPRMPARQRNPP
jgi:type IV secretory pathway protease TraF